MKILKNLKPLPKFVLITRRRPCLLTNLFILQSTPGQGFQKAPESVLSTRKSVTVSIITLTKFTSVQTSRIKPLPSRNAASKPMFGEVSIANVCPLYSY
jgi:hypothetical protein